MEQDQLRELFRMQKALNERIGVHTDTMTEEQKTEWVLNYCRAMGQEMAELTDSVPWKWWAKYQKFDEQNARVEVGFSDTCRACEDDVLFGIVRRFLAFQGQSHVVVMIAQGHAEHLFCLFLLDDKSIQISFDVLGAVVELHQIVDGTLLCFRFRWGSLCGAAGGCPEPGETEPRKILLHEVRKLFLEFLRAWDVFFLIFVPHYPFTMTYQWGNATPEAFGSLMWIFFDRMNRMHRMFLRQETLNAVRVDD